MRAILVTLAVLGGGLLAAALGVSVATGDGSEAAWILVGPLPFYAVGLIAYLRRPGYRVVWWLLGLGVAFGCEVALGDVFLPMAENHWGTTSSITATIALVRQWAGTGTAVTAVGLIGLCPSGRPERTYERVVIWTVGLLAFGVPLLGAVTADDIAMGSMPSQGAETAVRSSLAVQALAPLGGVAEVAYRSYPFWTALGVVLLALRYRRTDMTQRRQIRWLLLGVTVSFALWFPWLFWSFIDDQSRFADVAAQVLSPLALLTALGALLAGLFTSGVFGIDEPARRGAVHRVLRVSITTALAAVAVSAGVLASLAVPTAAAVVVAVAVAVAGQGVRRRFEHAVDRWVLGARLAGYANLSRFGESLTRVPGSADLLGELAGEVRRGLGLTWVRVVLETAGGPLVLEAAAGQAMAVDGTAAGEPAAIVPIGYHGTTLGRIECGPRTDGPLLAEDRRLLAYFAAQAAVGVHNRYLAAELSGRMAEIADQAVELAASRDRVVAGQDAERRRIQRVLHDGVQQEIVALSARAGLVRQRLLRGDPAAAEALADMQRDLATALQDVRELAYAIHPPVLSDRGLLEAIEAQSSRLVVPMAVRADPSLRGVRFGEQIEATAWYVVTEALSNVVKHAGAAEVEVSLDRQDGRLALAIRDDGCGFDANRPRGLGLTGLSDRLATVGGSLTITSGAGRGTSVSVHIPVDPGHPDG
jgi:signal transduction histidine kinase